MEATPRLLGGRYEVGELLGRGGMAEVHVGRDTRLGRSVAVKMLRSDLARDPSFQARFKREAQSAAALNHPTIVAVYDTGEDEIVESGGAHAVLPFIVMEYVRGRTLRDLLRDGERPSIEESLRISAAVLQALEYSHRAGIVHRDIKPANVMLTPTGDVKVMDFGIARAVADSSATMTQTQAVIGTAQYLSPEQARGETVDARSDLYSAGCLLYELLTGRPPFVADSPVAVAYQHVREQPQAPSVFNPEVTPVIDRIVLHALAKDRDERYQTAGQFRTDLEAVRRGGAVLAPSLAAAIAAAGAADALPTQQLGMTGAATEAMSPVGGTQAIPVVPGGRDPDQDEPPSRGRRPAYILLLLAVIAIFILAAFFAAKLFSGNPVASVRVPSLGGKTQAVAVQMLTDAGLKNKINTVPSNTVPKGTVADQSPPAGTTLAKGSTVTVDVSGGPNVVTVPDVSGKSQSEARQALLNAGLVPGDTKTENSGTVKADSVIRTDPAANAQVPSGSTVALVVSSGNVVVPDERGKNQNQAAADLSGLGLKANIVNAPSDKPTGQVIDQDQIGKTVPAGTTITLTVSIQSTTVTQTPTTTPTGTPCTAAGLPPGCTPTSTH